MTIKTEIDGAAENLLDAAPVERGVLDAELAAVGPKLSSFEELARLESAALAYARAAAERAFELGLALGRQERKGLQIEGGADKMGP